jgi:hypothetical protein
LAVSSHLVDFLASTTGAYSLLPSTLLKIGIWLTPDG